MKTCFRDNILRLFAVFVFMTLYAGTVRAQDEDAYATKANIIYHFTRYVNWPESAIPGELIIGVVDDTPTYSELRKLVAHKTARGRKISVRIYSSSVSSFDCHILFISEYASRHFRRIATRTNGQPLLLVSESEGFAHHGACINFKLVDERLKLEINKNNIENRNLRIATELLQLGIPVK